LPDRYVSEWNKCCLMSTAFRPKTRVSLSLEGIGGQSEILHLAPQCGASDTQHLGHLGGVTLQRPPGADDRLALGFLKGEYNLVTDEAMAPCSVNWARAACNIWRSYGQAEGNTVPPLCASLTLPI
jgi:hypothetical protein